MDFTFNEKSHTYLLDGKKMTGVTTIIGVLAKPQLIGWAARMAAEYFVAYLEEHSWDDASKEEREEVLNDAKSAHTKKKEAAGDFGTNAHALVEEYVKKMIDDQDGKPFEMNDDPTHYWESISPFIKWSVENVDHFLFSERRMFNKEMFVAGTADFGCVLKTGQKLIGDFKTSSGVFGIDYYLQCAGYKILAESNTDEKYDGCVIVRLGKKGQEDFDVTYNYDTKTAENAFMACLTIYRAQAALKESEVRE